MSINSLYEISRRSFRAMDAAMNVTGQNVANANTEGYSRRRLTLQADSPAIGGIHTSIGTRPSVGIGVSAASYERVRDGLMDRAAWDAYSSLGSSQEEHRVLQAIESLFPGSGPGSLTGQLNDFWNSWSDLADNPTDDGVRLTVRSHAQSLTTSLNRLDGQLETLTEETRFALGTGLDEANALLQDIARLNVTVREAEFRGSPDLEAQDLRDQKVAALAQYAPVKVQEKTDGYTITVNGMAVVQGDHFETLKLDNTGGVATVLFGDTGVEFPTGPGNDGKLGALLRMLNTTIPETRGQLDQLARGLVREVNAVHVVRYDDAGVRVLPDAPNFFYYASDGLGNQDGVTAASIRISDEVQADASIIGTPGFYTAGGDEIAFSIAQLRQSAMADTGGETSENFVINLMTDIGSRVKQASSKATAQTTVVDHLNAMSAAVSGVSMEEEMTNLIRYQQAFAAAARVLTTTEEMMDTLLMM